MIPPCGPCAARREPVTRRDCGCTVWRCPTCGAWQHDPALPCPGDWQDAGTTLTAFEEATP